MKKTFYIGCSILLIIATSCSKHKDDVEDTIPKSSIDFLAPTQGASYHSEDSISIIATAVSTATIHGYDIIIRKVDDTSKLYFTHVHDHNNTLQISRKWKPNVVNTDLQAEVILYLDHDGNTGNKKVNFRINE